MIRKFKKKIGYYISKKEKLFVNDFLCGLELRTLKGTIRRKVDKDDAWYFALVQNATDIFDLGCNIGYTSLLGAIQKKNKSILLVDPNPEALSKASQNMIINGFGIKSKFVSAFVSDKDKSKINFYTVGSGEAGSMYASHAETAAAVNSFYEVETITIDTLVEKLEICPDLIKIDVEGAESMALKGATKLAAKKIAKFFIEMHATKELSMKDNATLVINWCNENNYKAFYLKDNSELTKPEDIAHRGKCHLLLLPNNELFPDYLKNIKEGSQLPETI